MNYFFKLVLLLTWVWFGLPVHMGLVWKSCSLAFGLEFMFTWVWFGHLVSYFKINVEASQSIVNFILYVIQNSFVYTCTVNWFSDDL